MASYTLQVSGHAEDKNHTTFPVTAKSTFKYFVLAGQILDYGLSEQIFTDLGRNNVAAAEALVKNTYWAGRPTPNYSIWDLKDTNYASGILQVGQTHPIVDISGTTETNPISFSNLLTLAVEHLGINVGQDDVTVYFNCCR